jgi:hypothetical protein
MGPQFSSIHDDVPTTTLGDGKTVGVLEGLVGEKDDAPQDGGAKKTDADTNTSVADADHPTRNHKKTAGGDNKKVVIKVAKMLVFDHLQQGDDLREGQHEAADGGTLNNFDGRNVGQDSKLPVSPRSSSCAEEARRGEGGVAAVTCKEVQLEQGGEKGEKLPTESLLASKKTVVRRKSTCRPSTRL